MPAIDILNDRQILQQLQGFEHKLPTAIADALSHVAFQARQAEIQGLDRYLDRPTPFTKRAFYVTKAYSRRPSAELYIRPLQAKYLQYVIEGGPVKTDEPVNIRLNVYGNIPGKRTGYLKRKTDFIATIHGIRGVWRRIGPKGRQVQLLVALDRTDTRRPLFPYYEIAESTFEQRFRPDMIEAIDKAIFRTIR